LLVPICAIGIWFLVVYGNYKIVERVFLIASIFYFSYVISGVLAHPPWSQVLVQLVSPHVVMSTDYFLLIMGLIGTTIAPWMMFYLQSSVVEKGIKSTELNYSRVDVISGSIVTGIVAFFIIIACALTLYVHNISISTAAELQRHLRRWQALMHHCCLHSDCSMQEYFLLQYSHYRLHIQYVKAWMGVWSEQRVQRCSAVLYIDYIFDNFWWRLHIIA